MTAHMLFRCIPNMAKLISWQMEIQCMRTFWCMMILLASTLAAVPIQAQERRPNILLMYTDDQSQTSHGFAGNKEIQTPHIDALARRGIYFDNAFVTTAICCSSRACFLTGQHMYRHGITDFKTPLSAAAFQQTYPALLKKSGYRTGFLGKYAIGNPSGDQKELSLPEKQFDFWYGFPQSINFRQEVDGQPRYLTEMMSEKAIEFLRENPADKPFCLTVAFKEPHGPFNYFDPKVPNIYQDVQLTPSQTFNRRAFDQQPDFIRKSMNGQGSLAKLESKERYQQELRTVYRTVTRADQSVGEILAELKRLKLDNNTIVIFTSDHGSLLGDHGLSGKWLMYENSIRVPFILYDPRLEPSLAAGRRSEMVLGIDIAPTILSLSGIKPPDAMQGQDLMPIVRGTSNAWRSHFYYQHTYNPESERGTIAESEGIRTKQRKYIRYPKTQPLFEQLFDLKNDPKELVNLAMQSDQSSILNVLRLLCDQKAEE